MHFEPGSRSANPVGPGVRRGQCGPINSWETVDPKWQLQGRRPGGPACPSGTSWAPISSWSHVAFGSGDHLPPSFPWPTWSPWRPGQLWSGHTRRPAPPAPSPLRSLSAPQRAHRAPRPFLSTEQGDTRVHMGPPRPLRMATAPSPGPGDAALGTLPPPCPSRSEPPVPCPRGAGAHPLLLRWTPPGASWALLALLGPSPQCHLSLRALPSWPSTPACGSWGRRCACRALAT